jgi:hypothetical protein
VCGKVSALMGDHAIGEPFVPRQRGGRESYTGDDVNRQVVHPSYRPCKGVQRLTDERT